MQNIKWRFNPGDRTGINDSGIETFRGEMITSLGREICQNSIDAPAPGTDRVKVEFKEFKLSRNQIPGIDGLEESFRQGLEFWSRDYNKVDQAINFFQAGLKVLQAEEISVLRVSDFNTTGLLKSQEHFKSQWFNLITAHGVSEKSGTAGGSYGIGKSAPFACTDLRTVFYSTLDIEGIEASQGVSRLATFTNDNSKENSGKGYYGQWNEAAPSGNTPVPSQLSLDPDFKRETSGTDLYLIGFKAFDNWEEDLIIALLESFIVSIFRDKLEIIIGDLVLSSDNLGGIMEAYFTTNKKHLEKTYHYYKVLSSEHSRTCIHDLEDLGKIEFKFLLGADVLEENLNLHRQALIVRESGMKIFDKGHFPPIPFAGILTLVDHEVDGFFRLLEPPRHDAWKVDLYTGPKTKTFVRNKQAEVFRFMRDVINEHGSVPVSDEMDVVGLGDYLPDHLPSMASGGQVAESIPDRPKSIEVIDIKKPAPKKAVGVKHNETLDMSGFAQFGEGDLEGGSLGDSDRDRKERKDTQGPMEEADTGIEFSKMPRLSTVKQRVIPIDVSKGEYKIIVGASSPINLGVLELVLKTEVGQEKASIDEVLSFDGEVVKKANHQLYFKLVEEKSNMSFTVKLKYKGICSLGVKLYGSKL